MGAPEGFFTVCAGAQEVLDDPASNNDDIAGRFDCAGAGVGICAVYLHLILSSMN